MSDALQFQLLNDFQRDFPLCPAPFAELASRLALPKASSSANWSICAVRARFRASARLCTEAHRRPTLAAMAVPPEKTEIVAQTVNRSPR